MHKIYHTIVMGAAAVSLLLGSWRGHVALFMTGKDAPVEVYPVRLELLPDTDQELLRQGIAVDDPQGLARILEDFLS